jgi:hypothetical protein
MRLNPKKKRYPTKEVGLVGLRALETPAVAATLPQGGGLMPPAVRPSVDLMCLWSKAPGLLSCIHCGTDWGCWAECAGPQVCSILSCLR